MFYGPTGQADKAYHISPCPNISYSTEPYYVGGVVAGVKYNINLNGMLVATDKGAASIFEQMRSLNELFKENHYVLTVCAGEAVNKGGLNNLKIVMVANNILVRNITFNEGKNNYTQTVPYSIELESMHITFDPITDDLNGMLDADMLANMDTPEMVPLKRYSIKDWEEQFNLNTGEDQTRRTTSVERICDYGLPGDCDTAAMGILTTLGGEYFTVSYSIKATGKQIAFNKGNNVMPGWEHAKRFAQRKLEVQVGGFFQSFLGMNGDVDIDQKGGQGAAGAFSGFDNVRFGLYNEHYSFDVSESDQTFGITYNAMIKRKCPSQSLGLPLVSDYYTTYCDDDVLHTVTKNVQRSMEQNEYTQLDTQNTTITLSGSIKGLIEGIGVSRFRIDTTRSGSFLTCGFNTLNRDRYSAASIAFDRIFDYNNYDLKPDFKALFGVTPYHLRVSPTSRMLPANISVVRNHIEGTIDYTATYSTSVNCDPNNFEIQISTKHPNPVVAEMTVPNNNIRDVNDKLCDTGKGYNVIQLLGTKTPLTIDVSINASVANDFNKCCFGTNENYNMLDYDFFRLTSFVLPPGMVIPYISDSYALTKKTKSVKYPAGSMSFSLSYICGDFCSIENYFSDVNFKPIDVDWENIGRGDIPERPVDPPGWSEGQGISSPNGIYPPLEPDYPPQQDGNNASS